VIPEGRRRRAGAWAPDVHVCGGARSWRSPDRRLLHASPPGGGVFDRSPSLRPDLRRPLSRPSADRHRCRPPFASGRQAQFRPPSRQRRRARPCRDAFHRRVLPPPSTPGACAPCAWDHEEPATGVAARVLVAFATATRLPAPLHPLSSAPHEAGHESQRARPRICRSGTRRRSSTSATNSTREHDRRTDRSPPRVQKNRAHVRSRAPLAPLSGVGSTTKGPKPFHRFAAEGPSRAARPKPHRPTGPCTEHGQHRLLLWSPARGRRPPAKTATSRGFTGQGPAACAAGVPSRDLPFGRSRPPFGGRSEGATPTRSARTPLVVRPWHRRLERPAIARQCSRRSLPTTIPPHEHPPPRRVSAHGPPDDPLARGRRQRLSNTPLAGDTEDRCSPCVACADTRGARAASPALPRRRPRSAAPEVPSIGEPATPSCPGRSQADWRLRWGKPPCSGVFPQVVTSLWEILDAFVRPRCIHALDGAMGRRSSDASG